MHFILMFFILIGKCMYCWSVCTYPSDLIGEWYSTSFGTLNFETNQSFSGFTSALSVTSLTFTCFESSGDQYVSMSSYTVFANIVADVYLCMNLQQISTIKYYFTLDSNKDTGTGIRFYTPAASGDTVTLSQACSRSDIRSPGEYELLIKKDQLSSSVTSCPSSLQSTFDVTMTTSSVTDCNGTRLEGSTGALVFNYSSCVTETFNSAGYLGCLYSKSDGYSYATLYNNDTTTDGSSTYMFTCLTYEKDAAILNATEYPNTCHPSQTPTTVDSPGITFVMTDLLYTTVEEKEDYTVIIIVVACLAGAIVFIIIVVILYFKVCRRPTPEPPATIRKKKRKLSVTDYTPRSLSRSSSVEKMEEVSKQSTGEVLTGIIVDKIPRHLTLNGVEFDAPKKEAWQQKWEHDRHRGTPRLTAASLQRMKQSFTSEEGISRLSDLSVFELDKAFTMSTSLPENLDYSPKQRPKERKGSETLVSPKYSEKSDVSGSIPPSTGKFGISARAGSMQLPRVEPRLDTISENPLSRENTAFTLKSSPSKRLHENPNLMRILSGDVTSLSFSTVLGSQGTASVGDIRLQNSFQSISRSSHLNASNASIFDDPEWLNENKKPHCEQIFESIKNIIPSIPKENGKDSKWFLESKKKPEISREDIDYFRSRNKAFVGLSSDKRKGRFTSLEIIAREQIRRIKRMKNDKTKPKLVRPASLH